MDEKYDIFDTIPKKKLKKDNCDDNDEKIAKDFSELPYDTILKIFQYLDFKSIVNCGTLCKAFQETSNDRELYKHIHLKYNVIDNHLLELYIDKIQSPSSLSIEYKIIDINVDEDEEDYTIFNDYLERLIKKCGTYLKNIHFENCQSDSIFLQIQNCLNLEDVSFVRCRGTFQALPSLKCLTKIHFVKSNIPNNVLIDTLRNNHKLKTLWLSDNKTSFKVNEICENMANYNITIEEVHFCEKKKVRATGIKALARCSKLKVLELIGGPIQCDPEDSFEQLAAGCPLLERLTINGWKEVNDENLTPILHFCTKLTHLDLRGIDITIKFCKEALLTLPLLKILDVYKCDRIKGKQIMKLRRCYQDTEISSQNCDY